MRPDERDAASLWDMIQACREITAFTGGMDYGQFIQDRMLVLATERCLEIMGEAAGRLSPEFMGAHAGIPWQVIRGMRDILAHEYGRVDYEVMYRTVTDEVPPLQRKLERLLPDAGAP